jgi:ribosome-binding factor A
MTRKKPSRREMELLCAEIREDDGIDPKDFFRKAHKRGINDRKDLQLCRQVAETLNLVLSGELNEDLLGSVYVASVMPAPDASQLLVCLAPLPGESVEEQVLLEQVRSVAGWLRAEVATAITRKRAPKLLFRFLATDPMPEERS